MEKEKENIQSIPQPKPLDEKIFLEVVEEFGKMYGALSQVMSESILEKQMVLTKITEAGMWFKMYRDMLLKIDKVTAVLHDKKN